jgi:hypothetical protein
MKITIMKVDLNTSSAKLGSYLSGISHSTWKN